MIWWRRRESNPRPLAIHIMIYMLITFFNLVFKHRKEGDFKYELLFLFNQNKADWNLFEVGMGGKYDATNTLPIKEIKIEITAQDDITIYLAIIIKVMVKIQK